MCYCSQAHDIFERMQKQSKNYIARAKRSVQSGQDPDEDLLHKSRKLHRELLEIDEQKLAIATVLRITRLKMSSLHHACCISTRVASGLGCRAC